MRIIDWSSDVCSSDLGRVGCEIRPGDMVVRPDLGATQAAKEALRHIGASTVERIRLAMVDPVSLVTGVEHVPMRSLVGVDEIGRESCRERVCELVLIWVVAVAVKKTKTHNKNK